MTKQPNETRAAQHMSYWYLQIQHALSDANRHQSHVTNTFMKTNGKLTRFVFIWKIMFPVSHLAYIDFFSCCKIRAV